MLGLINELNAGQGWPALRLSCACLGGFLCGFPPLDFRLLAFSGFQVGRSHAVPFLSLQGQDDPIAIRFNGFPVAADEREASGVGVSCIE